jgi:hypothetical protein
MPAIERRSRLRGEEEARTNGSDIEKPPEKGYLIIISHSDREGKFLLSFYIFVHHKSTENKRSTG